MTDWENVAGVPVLGPRLSSMLPQTNKISSQKTKWNLTLKKQKQEQLTIMTFSWNTLPWMYH